MSTEKRLRRCSGEAPAPAPEQEALPVDLLLEIVALADVAIVFRCAATGRTLRRAILDPAFRRRLAFAAEDGFHPALLLGVSYWEHRVNVPTHRVIHAPPPNHLRVRLDADSLLQTEPFEPVASRDGLLFLRRHRYRRRHEFYSKGPYFKVELRACDTLTGHVAQLPPTTLDNAYFLVVLSVGDAGRCFELLVADMYVRFLRTFSSTDGQWSAIREVAVPVPHERHVCYSECSAVIGRTVYLPRHVHAISHWDHVLALDVDSAEATVMDLPSGCFSRMMASKGNENLLLAAVRGRLCLLVSESNGIAMWTLTSAAAPAATWSRQVVISSVEIARQAGLEPRVAYLFAIMPISFQGFGERSGAVILSSGLARDFRFLRLDLGTKEEAPVVTVLGKSERIVRFTRFFLHEVALVSLLQAMKSF